MEQTSYIMTLKKMYIEKTEKLFSSFEEYFEDFIELGS